MSTLNVSLRDSMRESIGQTVANGGYSTASEYIRELVRRDQKRAVEARLEGLLLEGLESGEPVEISDAWWQKKKAELTERLQRAKKA